MSEDKHSLLSPSSAHRWAVCAASVNLTKDMPRVDSEAAIEGREAHELAAKILEHSFGKSGSYGHCDDVDLKSLDDIFLLDNRFSQEMYDNCIKYVKYIYQIATIAHTPAYGNYEIHIEKKVDYAEFMPNNCLEYKGTADCILFKHQKELDEYGDYEKNYVMHIVDFKYGFGKIYAKENYQLLLYALGAIIHRTFNTVDEITLHIIQPRINHYDSWTLTRDELLVWGGFFKARALEVFKPNPTYTPDEKACKHCPAKAVCPALHGMYKKALEVMDYEGDKGFGELRYILDNASLLKFYINFMENAAIAILEEGRVVEGYKLGKGRSSKKLKEGAEEVLYQEYGDEIYKKSLLAYGQMKELLRSEHLQLFETVEGKTKLIREV